METFQQLKHDIGDAWEYLAEGWENLTHKATNAITRFTHAGNKNQLSDEEYKDVASRSIGWGVMAAEVFDDDDKIIVRLEVPGLDAKELDIQVNEDVLTVAGEKKLQREHAEGYYHIKECAYGRFERAIALPDEVDSGKAQADYKNGVLRIELPKSPNKQRKKIKVQVS